MAASPSSNPKHAGDDRNLVPPDGSTALSFEDKVHEFWQKNQNLVLGTCAAVVLAILAKGGWDYMQRQKDLNIEGAYAAATTTEQLKRFAAEHGSHTLGAIAELRIADEAYAGGKSADAIAGYDRVIAMLQEGPLADRARLGRALAMLQGARTADGTAELQKLSADGKQLNAVRAEAAYHLASLAATAGNATEVQRLSEQLMQIDPTSPWASRAMMLRASMPAAAGPASTPGITLPAAEQGQDEAPKIELKLPGKQ